MLVLPNEENYKLISIANHLGVKIKCGHYQALIKIGTKWIKCDDDSHIKTSLDKEIHENNYIVVYEKIHSVSASPSSGLKEKIYENEPDLSKEHILQQTTEEHEYDDKLKNQNIEQKLNREMFLFVNGKIKFEEVADGQIKCGGFGETFTRMVGHLSKNPSCSKNVNIEEFKSIWSKFLARRRKAQCRDKKDKGQFLKDDASRKKMAYTEKQTENKEKLLNHRKKFYQEN